MYVFVCIYKIQQYSDMIFFRLRKRSKGENINIFLKFS